MSKKGGRRSLPANLLPQGTTYQMDQVDYGYSPRANSRANQKFERSPKQNRSNKPEKQSYDRVEVRLLKRPTEKSVHYYVCVWCLFYIMHSLADKVTSPAKSNLNDSSTVASTAPVTPPRQDLLTGKKFYNSCFVLFAYIP